MSFVMQLPTTVWEALTSRREGTYSKRQIVLWWEHRRLYYNLLLAFVGVVAFCAVEYFGGKVVEPGEDVIEPMALFVIVPLFALCANVCYTLGWIVDLLSDHEKPSPRLLVAGCSFSIFVTLVPALFFGTNFVVHSLTGNHI